MPLSIETQNDIYKSGEVLRRVFTDLSTYNFIYSDQETVVEYPVGLIQRVSEVPVGLGFVEYTEFGEEQVSQFFNVSFQVSFITDEARGADIVKAKFLASSVLSALRTSWKSSEFNHLMVKYKRDLGVDVNVLTMGSIQGGLEDEAGRLQVPASFDVELSVRNVVSQSEAVPCLEPGALPIEINLNID